MIPTDTKQVKASEHLNQDNEHQQQENIDQSIESYQKAIELNPNSFPALSKLAEIYSNQKEYGKAFTYYLKIISLQPEKPIFLQNLVRVSLDYSKLLLKKNDLNKAIAAYREFLNQKLPRNVNADKIDIICHNLGEVILLLGVRQGEFSPAITFFQQAIGNSPYKTWSYYHLGNLSAKQGNIDEAMAYYEKAVEIRPKFPLGLLSLGQILLKKGRRNQAFQCGLKILRNQGYFKYQRISISETQRLNDTLNHLLSLNSNHKKSKEALRKAIEQIEISSSKPDLKSTTYRNIGNILRNQGDLVEAGDFYQKSIYCGLQKSKPKFVNLYWELGQLRGPDFLVIGFGKCGTTSFYNYLCQHPQVVPAVIKEPAYLYRWLVRSKDFEARNWSLPSAEKDFYLAHFVPRPEGSHFITGEASTSNIVPGVEKIISSWFPKIKLIVFLREPVKRTISHYEQTLKSGNQNRTLEEVISSELDELEATTNPAKTITEKLKRGWQEHIAMSLYVYPLERWMNLFPREQFLILTNEDLAQYPAETMKQAFDFLGLPEYNAIAYHPQNVGSYPQIDENLLSRLSNFFQPHNQRLEEFLGREFNWQIRREGNSSIPGQERQKVRAEHKPKYGKLIKAGIEAQQQANLELALDYSQKAIEENPQNPLGYRLIDKILRELGKLEEANNYYYSLLKTTPEAWEEEYILRLRVGHVRDGILIPLANTLSEPPFQGGIKTNKNCPTYFYHLRNKFFEPTTNINYLEQQDHQPSVKLNGTYLYAGFAFRHFGHYMVECTHRLWAYSKLTSSIKGVVILPEKKGHKLSPFMEQALTYMQIPLKSVQLISTITEVEHLIVPEQASHIKNPFKLSSSYLDFLSENEEKFFHSYKSQNSDYPEKLYVSRSHLIHKGGIAGEAYIETILQEDENFYIFKPENYSLHEQMNYYRHAKVCIFSEGSAIHGLELLGWLNKMSTVAIIFRRAGNQFLSRVIESRSQNLCQFKSTKMIHPLKNDMHKRPNPANILSIFSNVDLLLKFFRDNDLGQLKNFNLNDFYQQEAMDILNYVMKIDINKNNFNSDVDFLSYFNQFRNDIHHFSQNPYLT